MSSRYKYLTPLYNNVSRFYMGEALTSCVLSPFTFSADDLFSARGLLEESV